MKWATTLFALLTAIAVGMPAFAAGEAALRSHVRENVYPGAGPGAHLDAARAEREAGLPPELAAIHGGDAVPPRSSRSMMLGGFAFNLGPRSLPWPSGFDRHAGDLFSHRNIFRRVYGDGGMDGADISYRFGESTELSVFGAFDARYADPVTDDRLSDQRRPDRAYGVEMATRASVLDLSIRYAEAREDGADAGVSPEGVLIPVRWRLVSAGINAGVGDLGLHAEGGHAWLKPEDGPEREDLAAAYSHFLVGVDYTFENDLYLVLEYFQESRTAGGDGVQTDRPLLLTGDGQTPGRDNYLVGARYPLTDLTSIEFYNIVNDGDASILVNPWLILSAGDMFSLKLSARIPFAKDHKPLEDAASAAFGGIQINF